MPSSRAGINLTPERRQSAPLASDPRSPESNAGGMRLFAGGAIRSARRERRANGRKASESVSSMESRALSKKLHEAC